MQYRAYQSMEGKSLKSINFKKRNGIIPVVVQDLKTKEVLMLAYVNQEALKKTNVTGNAWFWSTSKGRLWMKGEESGNIQPVKEVRMDCDLDAALYIVESDRPACHTGQRSCFHHKLAD
jgi:phosphoribosyl-AMP cyclohydrolase